MTHPPHWAFTCFMGTKVLNNLIGRGTFFRVILDRCSTNMDDMWSSLDFTIHQAKEESVESDATATATTPVKDEW